MPIKKPDVFETAFEVYQVLDVVGQGGSGIVYAVNTEDQSKFAIKCIKPNQATSQRIKRFKNELFFCLKNSHPNIVKVLDYGFLPTSDGKAPFYVMPYFPSTLRHLMGTSNIHKNFELALSQILSGLEAAHLKDSWHRDLKPENILYDSESNRFVIADFGIAHFTQDELHTAVETKQSDRLANFLYAAPEQRTRDQEIDHRADIFAIGLIINEIFTGNPPLGSNYQPIAEASPEYSYLDPIVDLMIRNRPVDRIQTIGEVKKELIARKKEFVSQQKLSDLRGEVIPEYSVDDPLILDPLLLDHIDYQDRKLILIMTQSPNKKWISTFKSIGNYQFLMGKEPSRFYFEGNIAIIVAEENQVQTLVNYFKQYLVQANSDYERIVKEELSEMERQEKLRLQRAQEEEERRLRILRGTEL